MRAISRVRYLVSASDRYDDSARGLKGGYKAYDVMRTARTGEMESRSGWSDDEICVKIPQGPTYQLSL
jgi:hypothetical protein